MTTTPSGDGGDLASSLMQLAVEARALRSDVRADSEQRRRENQRMFAVFLVVAVVMAGLLVIGVQNRRINGQNAEIIRRNEQISTQIADCTTAGGVCYERGSQRTGAAIAELVRSNKAIALCARIVESEAALDRCVEERLARPAPSPTP